MSESSRPIVAITQLAERHRSQERVYNATREALDYLGGISRFVHPGQTVLIKPNQSVFSTATEGCTTDPLVVSALIRLAREAGAARVQIGESSAAFLPSVECMHAGGLGAIAERDGAKLVDLGSDSTPNVMVPIREGRVLRQVPLPLPLIQADVIINVPKAKNHYIDPISGALENWIGILNQHWRHANHCTDNLAARYVDILAVARPALCVVDALIVGEGDGPLATHPRWCGCILASTDPAATDVTIARLLGRDWKKLEFAKEAEERGLGRRHPIDFRGIPLERVALNTWSGHEGFQYLPLNLLIGAGVTLSGTIGHVKSILDLLLRRGEIPLGFAGTPTLMLGEIDDPLFEQRLREGPYLVIDDAAKPTYKSDPRVHFVPGHPVLWDAAPMILDALGVAPSRSCLVAANGVIAHPGNGSVATRRAKTLSRPMTAASIAAFGYALARGLWRKDGAH